MSLCMRFVIFKLIVDIFNFEHIFRYTVKFCITYNFITKYSVFELHTFLKIVLVYNYYIKFIKFQTSLTWCI